MWAFYPPVVLYILYLGIRHRCFTLFTAANPGIPHSGIALMSKSEILNGLMTMPERVATFTLLEGTLPTSEKWNRTLSFMNEHSFHFPIVLKPDFGERGKGVAIVHNQEQALAYFNQTEETLIVQEYIPGIEFGVFYMRHPSQDRGCVFSLTAKCPTYVHGDGRKTLEQLILDDPRAVCMARFFLREFETQLHDIIPAGERFTLAQLGTHSRGSLFLDAQDIWSEELESAFDKLSQSFDGFYIGRYDVRVDTHQSIKAGTNFKVVELNGVVSEPTHMYDPKHNLVFAYFTMFSLWKKIFAIGAANKKRGSQPSSLKELRQLMREFRSD